MRLKFQPITEITVFKKSTYLSAIILTIVAIFLGFIRVTSMILYILYNHELLNLGSLLPTRVTGYIADLLFIFTIIGLSVTFYRLSKSEIQVEKSSRITAIFLLIGGIFHLLASSFSITFITKVSIPFYLFIKIFYGVGYFFLRKTFIEFKSLELFPKDSNLILVYSQIVAFVYDINIAITEYSEIFSDRAIEIYFSVLIILIILYYLLLSIGFFRLSSDVTKLKDPIITETA